MPGAWRRRSSRRRSTAETSPQDPASTRRTETRESPLFGTDGVRGRAGDDLTAELAMGLARAASEGVSGLAVVGRDTRRSGPMLASAVHAGFNAGGLDTVDVGVLPVGGVSTLVRRLGAAFGVMVSASHNPAPDNGIKFFGSDGSKLDDPAEESIAARYRTGEGTPGRVGDMIGTQRVMADAAGTYVADLMRRSLRTLGGLAIVLDTAHGAAFETAPELFRRLGAQVEVMNAEPTGMNINDGCGAVHPEGLASTASGRIGLAFDGDADRCVAVDEDGSVCNGDVIMAVLARHSLDAGHLTGRRVVTTVMANLGFRQAMQGMGVEVIETPVGDRHVIDAMRATGAVLGGEQSGHVILDGAASGDGLFTAMRLLEVVAETGKALRELRTVMTEYPQVLINVPVAERGRLSDAAAVWSAVRDAEARLGEGGRVLVRESGTEPLVRVMVEAVGPAEAQSVARGLVAIVERELA
jgi:phosphoglucosamine mutase